MTTAAPPLAELRADAPMFIVLNAGSGSLETQQRIDTIGSVLSAAGRVHEVLQVHDPRQLGRTTARAIELATDRNGAVVAAGGDGTINAVTQQVLYTGLPFGVLPQGTFNYFGRVHGIPTDTEEAVRALLTARLKPVQVGLINDRVFNVNASMGIYPQLLEDREAFKQRFGRTRVVALVSGLVTLLRSHRSWNVRLELDGESRSATTTTLFVGNNQLQFEQIGIAQAPSLQERQLVGIMLKPVGKLEMLGLLFRGALGQLGEAEKVSSFAFTSLTIEPRHRPGKRRVKVATDGEISRLPMPLHFRPAPAHLQLMVPAEACSTGAAVDAQA
jgi:diacylglycerol kinase family enzyme